MSDKFDFLRKKKEEKPETDWNQVKEMWIQDIEDFYSQIQSWLKEAYDEGLLTFFKGITGLEEENIGIHQAPYMQILTGNKSIEFIPVGRLIIGATGRIDIRTSKGDLSLLRSENSWLLVRDRNNRHYDKFTEDIMIDLLKWVVS